MLLTKLRLFVGPVRNLCSLAPNNVNTMAGAAIAAHNLGFDHTFAKLIADPALVNLSVRLPTFSIELKSALFSLRDYHIVEYQCSGENGFCVKMRRENPAKQGAVTGSNTYFSFLSSVLSTLHMPPGFNLV